MHSCLQYPIGGYVVGSICLCRISDVGGDGTQERFVPALQQWRSSLLQPASLTLPKLAGALSDTHKRLGMSNIIFQRIVELLLDVEATEHW